MFNLKQKLQGFKTVRICGTKFVIKKINPLLDFTSENMPQIFSSFISRRGPATPDLKNIQKQMMDMVSAGLVEPKLVPVGTGDKKGNEEGITVDDLFRDETLAIKLYQEILIHSLNKFRGLKGVFFLIKLRRAFYIELRKNTANSPQQ